MLVRRLYLTERDRELLHYSSRFQRATAFMCLLIPSVNGSDGTHTERYVVSDRLCTGLVTAITTQYHPTFIQLSSSVNNKPKVQQTD